MLCRLTDTGYGRLASRFGTLIKLKKRQVLKRAGATTARELYDSHLRTSQSLPQLSSRAGPATNRSRVSAGHFLADTQPKSMYDELQDACGARVLLGS